MVLLTIRRSVGRLVLSVCGWSALLVMVVCGARWSLWFTRAFKIIAPKVFFGGKKRWKTIEGVLDLL